MNLLHWNRKLSTLFILSFLFLAPVSYGADYCGDDVINEGIEECDDGNFINRDGCSSYCKLEDMDSPTVSSVFPQNGSIGIDTAITAVTVVFSEPMDLSTLNDFNVQLRQGSEKVFDTNLLLASDQKTLTIQINEELSSEARHSIHIRFVKDIPGNNIDEEFISTFDTMKAIDRKAPTVVVSPPGDTYNYTQVITLTPYIGDYTNSDEFIDSNAKIYYTVNGADPTTSSPLFDEPIRLKYNSAIRYFAKDKDGNTGPVITERYYFKCADRPNSKKVSRYPTCNVLECNPGFLLKSNTCVARLGDVDPDDYKTNAVTAPLFGSSTPTTITTKPAIYITKQHRGIIPRPIIFKDQKRGTIINFERDTMITTADGEPFEGYIRPPINYYSKHFPIHFGYNFKSIFELKDADNREIRFHPPVRIVVPYTDAFEEDEGVKVFTYDPDTEMYTEYNSELYISDLDKQEVTITSDKSTIFFVAQSGKNYNRAEFKDMENHWARNYAESLYRKGMVKGRSKGEFAPDENLTRAEFLKIALKAIGAETENPDEIEDTPFRDVTLYAWYLPYVKTAKDLGLVRGYPDGTFKPEQFINRAEAIKILISAFNFDMESRTEDNPETETSRGKFKDLLTNEWYFPYVDFAIQNRLIDGYRRKFTRKITSAFAPDRPMTRGEMAKLAIKSIELAEEFSQK